jgi:hypothetical protein
MSIERARGMRADMLVSMAKVREAYRLYLKIWDEYRDRVREAYGYEPGETLRPEHEKLAEQTADRDPISIGAVATIKTHQPLALTFGVAYLVEADASWRLDDTTELTT